jgi:hypothetical protein
MAVAIIIDEDNKIIHRQVTGELYTDRSLRLVRELALSVGTYKNYNVMMDMRGTETKPEMLDLMAIASECAKLKSDFNNKIAFLIPDTEERIHFAQLFKTCMETQGFRFKQFFNAETAMEWLTDKG